jgi:hypothetical protein
LAPSPPDSIPIHHWRTTRHRRLGSASIQKKSTLPRLRFKKFESATRFSNYRNGSCASSPLAACGQDDARACHIAWRTVRGHHRCLNGACGPGFCFADQSPAALATRRRRQHLAVSPGIGLMVTACSVKTLNLTGKCPKPRAEAPRTTAQPRAA